MDLRLNPAVFHFLRQQYNIPHFTQALNGINYWEHGMEVYKQFGRDSEGTCPFFVSPSFVEDIALQPMLEGEIKLWT